MKAIKRKIDQANCKHTANFHSETPLRRGKKRKTFKCTKCDKLISYIVES